MNAAWERSGDSQGKWFGNSRGMKMETEGKAGPGDNVLNKILGVLAGEHTTTFLITSTCRQYGQWTSHTPSLQSKSSRWGGRRAGEVGREVWIPAAGHSSNFRAELNVTDLRWKSAVSCALQMLKFPGERANLRKSAAFCENLHFGFFMSP